MSTILCIIYWIASYWALDYVWYSRRVYLVRDGVLWIVSKALLAIVIGWLMIPIAIIMKLLGK